RIEICFVFILFFIFFRICIKIIMFIQYLKFSPMNDRYSDIVSLTGSTLIGQQSAKNACLDILCIVKDNTQAGLAFILQGENSINTLVSAIEKDLNKEFNMVKTNGFEISTPYDIDVLVNRSIKIKIEETKDCLEGEVTKINIIRKNDTVETVELGIKTAKGTKITKLSGEFYNELISQRIEEGDIIFIEASAGLIKRLGRSETFVKAYDLERDKYIPLPTNEVRIKKKVIKVLNLQNFNPNKQIEDLLDQYEGQGYAEITHGIIYIENIEKLNRQCGNYLAKVMESGKAPTFIFSTRNKLENINERILEKSFVIKVDSLSNEDIKNILIIKNNGIIQEEIIDFISKLEITLKNKIEILEIMKNRGMEEIKDVEEIMSIFNFQ
ncbi:RuvB/Pontin protein, partial [Spraguea lophii 42_110]